MAARLQELVDEKIVRPVTLAESKRREGYPHTFYGVTDYGWRFLISHNLLDSDRPVLRW